MKVKLIMCFLVSAFCLLIPASITAQSAVEEPPLNVEEAFKKNNIEYYAYMDIDNADENLREIILEARKQIINSVDGWAADGVEGYVVDSEGNIKEKIPCFHELFPLDWEPPF